MRPPRRVYDERTAQPSLEMYCAFGQTLRRQGCDGMYLGYLRWPFAEKEYEILREAACPQAVSRRDKRYLLQPREPGLILEELIDYQGDFSRRPRQSANEITEPPDRVLPIELHEGKLATALIFIWDEFEGAKAEGEMRPPILTIRFADFCVDDEIEIRCNGRILPIDEAEVSHELGVNMALQPRGSPLDAPLGISAHWFRYRLDLDLLREGENVVDVVILHMESTAGFTRSLNGIEVQTRYRDFVRPEGLERARIVPR